MKHTFTTITALILALIMALSCAAFAETADEDPVVVTYDGGEIRKSEAQPELDYVINYYEQFGYNVNEYPDWLESIRIEVLEMLATDKIVTARLDGVQLISDERLAEIHEMAEAEFEEMVGNFSFEYDEGEEADPEADRASTLEYLESIGYTVESIEDDIIASETENARFEYLAGDVEVTEEDISEAYNEQLAADTDMYSSDLTEYEYACQYEDSLITWNPEGFRCFKQIVFTLNNDEDLEKLYELMDAKEAISDEDSIASIDAEIARLYETIGDTVNACASELAAGANFDEMIEKYTCDESYAYEPFYSAGYPVYAESVMYEEPVRDAAMALQSIGDISEPVQGDFGVYILQYVSDVTPGAVPLADIYDRVKETAEYSIRYDAYEATLQQWLTEANVQYFPENLG